jgi:hypothetical protein
MQSSDGIQPRFPLAQQEVIPHHSRNVITSHLVIHASSFWFVPKYVLFTSLSRIVESLVLHLWIPLSSKHPSSSFVRHDAPRSYLHRIICLIRDTDSGASSEQSNFPFPFHYYFHWGSCQPPDLFSDEVHTTYTLPTPSSTKHDNASYNALYFLPRPLVTAHPENHHTSSIDTSSSRS